jgi:adenosylmethionine-8-amino-7-oxononanoate aminotransferase
MSIDLAFDRAHLWHPYTSMANPLPVYPVKSANGVVLTLEDGRQLVDGTSSWWAAVHGYNHPALNAAIEAQLAQVSHVMFGGITHQPAVELGKLLLAMLPPALCRIFYADSGSIAVEVALKMALQYQLAKGHRGKTKILSLRKAYHGDTFAVCDPLDGMHQLFAGQLPAQLFADAPSRAFTDVWQTADGDNWRQMFAKHHHELAAFIIEPVLQGAGGMRLYHPQYLALARELCDQIWCAADF